MDYIFVKCQIIFGKYCSLMITLRWHLNILSNIINYISSQNWKKEIRNICDFNARTGPLHYH